MPFVSFVDRNFLYISNMATLQPPDSVGSPWGPYFWETLHLAAFYMEETPADAQRLAFLSLVRSYTHLLPCPRCRPHYAEILKKMPPDGLRTRAEFYTWTVQVHNYVNAHLKKPKWVPGRSKQQRDAKLAAGVGAAVLAVFFVAYMTRRKCLQSKSNTWPSKPLLAPAESCAYRGLAQ